jgi:hypothetical protein
MPTGIWLPALVPIESGLCNRSRLLPRRLCLLEAVLYPGPVSYTSAILHEMNTIASVKGNEIALGTAEIFHTGFSMNTAL